MIFGWLLVEVVIPRFSVGMDFGDFLDEPVQEQMQVQWWESAPRDNIGGLWEDYIHNRPHRWKFVIDSQTAGVGEIR